MRKSELLVQSALLASSLFACRAASAQVAQSGMTISYPEGFAVSNSQSLAGQPALAAISGLQTAIPLRPRPLAVSGAGALAPNVPDPSLQTAVSALLGADPNQKASFPGVGANGFAPGDPNLAVGSNHIVQIVNVEYAVFDKSGNIFAGYPKTVGSLFSALGGGCAGAFGDVIAQYDKAADRWLISQLGSFSGPFLECIAVSQTNDPTGPYNLYSYSFGNNLNDYPKIGVWPVATANAPSGAYLATYNLFANGATFTGADLCAYDRGAMLSGAASPAQVCFTIPNDGGFLPSDLDGSILPPAGSPGYFLTFETLSSLRLYQLTPNFANPASSTLSAPADIPVASFSEACGGATCIPQPGTTTQLDSLGDRLMYRLAYRNFGDHEALVVNHSVTAGSSVGVRWYELRNPFSGVTLYQQGTFAPDATFRWMGSAAMDSAGDMAIGYSASSSSVYPSLRWTGRTSPDPLGTMRTEASIFEGTNSQTGGLSRWGDYSALRIDPSDDCTFWYTNEYLPSNGSFNWATWVGSFKFSNCGATVQDFSLSVSPSSRNLAQGNSTTYTVTSTPAGGFTGDVTLSVSGLPAGASATFSPNPTITGGSGSSTVNVSISNSPPTGPYTLTITGTSGMLTHTVDATLVVYPPVVYLPYVDQGGFTNSGSTVTNPQGTLDISDSTLTFLSTDGSMAINATITTSSLVKSCAGGGSVVTCVYTFKGTFSGTLTLNGAPQAINGTAFQVSRTPSEIGNGSIAYNSAYTPLYFSNTGQLVRSDDLSGTNLTTYGTQGSGVGQFYGAYGMALDSSGRIYVADTYNARVVRIDDFKGTNWTTFGTYGSGAGQFINPTAISIDASGKIYVMDDGNSRLVRFDNMNGDNWTVAMTGLGSGDLQFAQYSTAVAFDASGRIYVADSGNSRIVRMNDLTGAGWTTLTQSPVIGSYIYSFANPIGVAVDMAGRIYVADASSPTASAISVDDMTGANWNSVSLGPDASPHSIAVDSGGMVLVGGGGAQIVDNMMGVLTSGSALTSGFGPYYVFGATLAPLPSPRPSAISFSPPALTFSQNVNTASTAQTITVTNFGGSSIHGLNILTSGVFSQTNNCPSVLVAATSCTITVSFTPSAAGPVTGSLNVTDDSYNLGPSQIVTLNGTGTGPGASITPTSLSFPAQVVGTTSSAQTIRVLSSGTGPLQVSNVVATAPFSQTNNCSGPMAPGASCTIQVSFAPTVVGAASGGVTITHNAGTQTVNLSGSGSAPVTFSPTSMSFGTVVVGTSSARTATVTNRLNAALTVNIAVSGPFAVPSNTNTCGTSIAAGASCTVGVTFSPTAVGSATGTLTFTDSALTSPQTVSLSGTGSAPVTLSPTSLSFSTTVAGNTSAAKTVRLTNNQTVALSISVAVSGPFAVPSNTNTCGTSVAAGASCTVGVTFSPTAVGSATGTLTFTDSAVTSPQKVNLSGTGSAPVALSPTSLSFSTTVAGNTSAAKTVRFTNNQAVTLSISVAVSGPFAVPSNTNTCGTSVAAGASCTVGVTFSPMAVGSTTGTLTFTDSAVTSPQKVNLSGTGSAPLTLSSSSINFSTVTVGTTSSARTVTLTNHLSGAVAVNVAASAGFAVASNTCGTSVAAGASCTVGVTFSPKAPGPVTGTLTFTDAAVTSPQVVTLSGTGH